MKIIVLASRNNGKTFEIQKLFNGSGITIMGLNEFPGVPQVEETGKTLEENALIKARIVFNHIQLPVLADDTGLEVLALNNAPGVYSARYAGDGATYDDNNRKLLFELSMVLPINRYAQFRCIAAYVDEQMEHLEEGICRGGIIMENRGTNGFGYDPLFMPVGYDKTFAELPVEIKNLISHRGMAFGKMKEFLLKATSVSRV